MTTNGQEFYSSSVLAQPFTREDVLAGRVIRISPALITITDGRMGTTPPDDLRREVCQHVNHLLDHGVRSFHIDINFDDYSGFGSSGPDHNAALFTPDFVQRITQMAQERGGFITLHLLTDHPAEHLRDFESIPLGAICFQLDALQDADQLTALIRQILDLGACASPVIETVGTDHLLPRSPIEVRALLDPALPQIGMLTFQAAGTAARSNLAAGVFARDQVAAYSDCLRPGFSGTIQIQGGITADTASVAVALGAEFLVAGTQLFGGDLAPSQVIDLMLQAAARTFDS
jgi:pentose-5-phosphate-3-epimerase